MGLDMYAYTINAKLVDDGWDTDFPVDKRARRAVGFIDLTDAEIISMKDEDRNTYYTKQRLATQKAIDEGFLNTEFAYWRKFNHLHGWMNKLYDKKGGTSESFNCNTVRLMPEDIDVLESLASLKALPATQGFFFGGDEPFDDDDKESVLDFVAKSRIAFSEGKAVFYDSWW
jgi:hypothetical protein